MRRSSDLLLLLFMTFLMVSCSKTFVMDADERPTVVVDYIMTNNPVQYMHLRLTKGASKGTFPVVAEANARLVDLSMNETEAGVFNKSEDGEWTMEYAAIPNHRYRLEVDVPGYDLITAEQTMPENKTIAQVCYSYEAAGSFWIQVTDPAFNAGFYDKWNSSSRYFIGLNNSTWVYGINYNEKTGSREIADKICISMIKGCDSFSITDEVYDTPVENTEFHFWSTGYDFEGNYTEYMTTAKAGLYHDLNGMPIYNRYIRISKDEILKEYGPQGLESGFYVGVSGDFKGEMPLEIERNGGYGSFRNNGIIDTPGDRQFYLVFATVSDEYDHYHEEALRFMDLQKSSDMTTIYLRNNMYTNISGGLGLFGAKNEVKLIWSDQPRLIYSTNEPPVVVGKSNPFKD